MTEAILLAGSVLSGWLLVHLTTPFLERFCHRHGLLDQPSARKIHTRATPRLTGISLFVALWGTIFLFAYLVPGHMIEIRAHAVIIVAGAVLILLLGIADDLRPLSAVWKLVGQIIVGTLLWLRGLGFSQVWVPFVGGIDLGLLSLPVTLFWFLVFVNAVNIIDGLDGLATATVGAALLPLIWISFTLTITPIWIAAAGLLGGLIAFWRYNRAPARVFMGDCGSLSLGYFFAVAALYAPIKRFTALAFFVPLIAMLLPLTESLLSVGRRSLARGNPMRADMGHLHHRLMAAGWSTNRVVSSYAVVTVAFGLFCVAFHYSNRRIIAMLLGFFVLLLGIALGIILRRELPSQATRNTAGKGSGG